MDLCSRSSGSSTPADHPPDDYSHAEEDDHTSWWNVRANLANPIFTSSGSTRTTHRTDNGAGRCNGSGSSSVTVLHSRSAASICTGRCRSLATDWRCQISRHQERVPGADVNGALPRRPCVAAEVTAMFHSRFGRLSHQSRSGVAGSVSAVCDSSGSARSCTSATVFAVREEHQIRQRTSPQCRRSTEDAWPMLKC